MKENDQDSIKLKKKKKWEEWLCQFGWRGKREGAIEVPLSN